MDGLDATWPAQTDRSGQSDPLPAPPLWDAPSTPGLCSAVDSSILPVLWMNTRLYYSKEAASNQSMASNLWFFVFFLKPFWFSSKRLRVYPWPFDFVLRVWNFVSGHDSCGLDERNDWFACRAGHFGLGRPPSSWLDEGADTEASLLLLRAAGLISPGTLRSETVDLWRRTVQMFSLFIFELCAFCS